LGDTALYKFTPTANKVLIEINFKHSFYQRFISPLEDEEDDDDKKIRSIRLLISSFVKAEIDNSTADTKLSIYLKKFKNSFSVALDEYIEDLYIG
jgi:hypothetical protein